jgi:hypothetical protein
MAARYGVALAASTAIAFVVIVPPAHWMQGVCDEIAINWAGPVVIGGLGLALAASVGPAHAAWRTGLLLATGGAALALFLAIEPRCVRGPYALMDPALWQVWLAHVTEMQPWLAMTRNSPAMGAGFAAFPLVALACTLWLAREGAIRRNFGLQVAAAMMVVALIMMMMAIKMSAYALWLGMPAVAASVLRLTDRLQISTFAARLFASIMLGPAVLSVAALTVVQAAARVPAESEDHRVEAG